MGAAVPLVKIARPFGVSAPYIHKRMQALPRAQLVSLVFKRVRAQEIAAADVPVVRVDLFQELAEIKSELLGVRDTAQEAPKKELSMAGRLNILLRAVDSRLAWVGDYVKASEHLLKLVNFQVWLEELLAMLAETSPDLRAAFVARLAARRRLGSIPDRPRETAAPAGPTSTCS